MDYHLSPAETAERFGTSIKALRLYEQHGLLKPLRTSNGATGAAWRVYGPEQFTRLHQILALKRLGLSLAQIGDLLLSQDSVDPILAFQEQALVKDSERISRALMLVRKARTKLASGEALSIDDLANLTKETVMTKHPTAKELNAVISPLKQKHLTPEDNASLREWHDGHSDLLDTGKTLMEEAKVLMASRDTTSAAAMDFARRFQALTKQMTSNASPMSSLTPKIKTMVDEARSDPDTSKKLEVFAFIEKVVRNLKAQEDATGATE